jgi:hypothetical protein
MRKHVALLWEAPLALASFLLLRATRRLLEWRVSRREARHPRDCARWDVFSAERLRRPLELPVLMVQAPRWNPHAIIATAGPFAASGSFRVRRAPLAESAGLWILLCYRKPGYRRVALVTSLDSGPSAEWIDVAVDPGRYILVLRYYRYAAEVTLPEVEVDGVPLIPKLSVPASVNAFYDDLARRGGLFYRLLHYYVHVLLRYRHLLHESFVKREYLPAGNPSTEFHYGLMPPRGRLRVEAPAEVLATHEVLVTFYSSASFPVAWSRATEPDGVVDPGSPRTKSYLVRVQPARAGAPAAAGRVRVTSVVSDSGPEEC